MPDPRPYFAELEDLRRQTKNKLRPLDDIVMIVFCAVPGGIEDWADREDFALEKEDGFRGFLELPNGIPTHDTLGDVVGRLKPWAFAALCVDGKKLRGSGQAAAHLLSALPPRCGWSWP